MTDKELSEQMMPIMRTGKHIPFSVLNEEWAQKNHSQTLTRLAERGGLSVCEAWAIHKCQKWQAFASIADEARALTLLTLQTQGAKP